MHTNKNERLGPIAHPRRRYRSTRAAEDLLYQRLEPVAGLVYGPTDQGPRSTVW